MTFFDESKPGEVVAALAVSRWARHQAGRRVSRVALLRLADHADEDLRRVRTQAARGLIQREAAGTKAKLTSMREVRRRREPAGSDEEGTQEVGGGRLPNLPFAVAAW